MEENNEKHDTEDENGIFEDNKFYKTSQVARILGCHNDTVKRRADEMDIPRIEDMNQQRKTRLYRGYDLNICFKLTRPSDDHPKKL